MKIDVTFLTAPGSGNNGAGKFYIAVQDSKAHFTIHGPNNPGTKGTITKVKDIRGVKTKLREKMRKDYTEVDPAQVSAGAKKTLIAEIEKQHPSLAGQAYTFQRGAVVFSGTAAPDKPRRPRSSASPIKDMWF